eukprot:EG_transcript_13689
MLAFLEELLCTEATAWDFSGISLGAEGSTHVAGVLKDGTPRVLHLRNCQMGTDGVKSLVQALQQNTSLRLLSLCRNQLGDEGARHLATALQTNTTLEEVRLAWNGIGDEGARHLAAALQENTTLQEIDLFYNKIGDEGGRPPGGGAEGQRDAARHRPLQQPDWGRWCQEPCGRPARQCHRAGGRPSQQYDQRAAASDGGRSSPSEPQPRSLAEAVGGGITPPPPPPRRGVVPGGLRTPLPPADPSPPPLTPYAPTWTFGGPARPRPMQQS